ncbi:hypothetical protein HDIA_2230 [Hartmannibacter diazotrophicus]|uniref:Uncharacterized protein n=1 Tax=Hartmannibacter diazotrophicus TaxID=1482074 RepID=A0A2C9D7P6_9HYPH|nr:hypothetical protein [Hartmannibacter diazotrophicus]SON55771.1 hypothetical protein HDIA_2230 [Hartmannibacter diazotrophicus]
MAQSGVSKEPNCHISQAEEAKNGLPGKPDDLGSFITNDLCFGFRRDAEGRWSVNLAVSETGLIAALIAAILFGGGFFWHVLGPSLGGLFQ